MVTKNTLDAGASKLIGRYELLAPVLSGALGELWQARIASGPEEGRFVDIRRIPRSDGLEMREVERLTNAGFAAMELRHPRIAAVLDVVVGAAEIAIVSEHVAGAILESLVRPQPGKRVTVPIGVASRVALDLLEAIDAIQQPWLELFPDVESPEDYLLQSCVHGGLLPDGLLVASFGDTMLLEAGLAGVALTIPSILDHPDVIAYRAPEQLEPGRTIDQRTDVFTIGILLWEMITGRSLFGPSVLPRPSALPPKAGTRADPIQVSAARRKVLSQPIARLDALPLLKGKVPKELADCVARCLERDPSLRFQTVREAIRALSTLDAAGLSRHDAVVALITSLGITQSREPTAEPSEGPSSNRPTAPPVEGVSSVPSAGINEGVTRPGFAPRRVVAREPDTRNSPDATRDLGEGAATHAAAMLAEVESIPPSTDVESLPPSESSPPLGGIVDTVPPSSADLDTLPPLAAVAAARSAIVSSEGSITLLSGVAPPELETPPAPREFAPAFPEVTAVDPRVGSPTVEREPLVEEHTSAPVVRPLGGASDDVRSGSDAPVEDPVFSERRDRSRKVVVGVMAGAAVLVLIAILRIAFSQGAAPAASAPIVTTPAVASGAPESPPAEAPATAPAESTTEEPSGAVPTSAPGAATGEAADNAHRPANVNASSRKRPYRPSGI